MACPDVVPEGASLRKLYERHQPENSVLYRVVQAWLETLLRMADEAYQRPLPRYVQEEFQNYLRCGILGWGLLVPTAGSAARPCWSRSHVSFAACVPYVS